MPRYIPYDMLQELQRGVTTHCQLLRIDPSQPGFAPLFVTSLDKNVTYDDGTGPVEYLAPISYEPSTQVSAADLSVSGGNFSGLLPVYDVPVSENDLVSGAYDFASFTAYLVNYEVLTPGRHVILGHGTTGKNTITDGGLAFMSELRGLSQALKQSLTEKWSLTCRATFGSRSEADSSGSVVERFPCNFDIESLYEAGTVEEVGEESNRTFTTSGLSPIYGGVPGMIVWTSGANAGRSNEVEGFDDDSSGQTIDLTFPTMFPIQIGDTFDFRDDCPKSWEACGTRNNRQWFRGEPTIPVSDAGQISVPGASAGIGSGGKVEVITEDDP